MLAFTVSGTTVYRGIRTQSRGQKLGIAFRLRDGKEEVLPVSPSWRDFILWAGATLEDEGPLPILSADYGQDELLPVDTRLDQPGQALVLVRPPRNGLTLYTSSRWGEKEVGRNLVLRDYWTLSETAGIHIFYGDLSPQGELGTNGMLLGMCPGSSFRMTRDTPGEPQQYSVEWWTGVSPVLRCCTDETVARAAV